MISRRLLRVKILQVLFAYFKSENDSLNNVEKELLHSIHKAFDLYHFLLYLPIEICDYAEGKMMLAKQKLQPTKEDLNPNTRFIDNKLIKLLRENKPLSDYTTSRKLNWRKYPDLIKKLYLKAMESDYFQAYMKTTSTTFAEDKLLVTNILSRELEDFDDLYQMLEEESIYWNDDLEFMLSMAIKTVKKFVEDQPDTTPLFPMYRSDDDEDYAKRLLKKVILKHSENVKLIDEFTKNWEVDRIASMDIIVMEMAITEISEFPSIPVKVSFNEYIEIAKYYSTDQSSTFINGVLDKIIMNLRKHKQISKQGRGLIGEDDERLTNEEN